MELEEIIRNYEYAKECIEESIEYITSGDCIYGADPKKESENTIHLFKELEKANKEGVLLEED